MRVAVVNLTAGGLSGGYRKYLRRLMPLLAADRRVSALRIFVPRTAAATFDTGLDVRTWDPGVGGRRAIASEVSAFGASVVFVPTARYATFGAAPVVTMVRNMEPLLVPFGGNAWTEGLRNVARAWEARRASKRARRVIAVSAHVREFLVRRWRIPEGRVGLVYHGVDPLEAKETAADSANRLIFTAGSIRPARGLEDVVRALPRLDRDVHLIVAGTVNRGAEPYAGRLRDLAATLGVSKRIRFVGELPDEAMEAAFRACAVFVMTSRAEACPNTALEAMSAGAVTVSVDHPPMPEFFGDAALYYPAGDAALLAGQLQSALDPGPGRARLSRAAIERARLFPWSATATRTISELERAIS
ncbi:glycosyltransferase family 1 protein [soil metagenome]